MIEGIFDLFVMLFFVVTKVAPCSEIVACSEST